MGEYGVFMKTMSDDSLKILYQKELQESTTYTGLVTSAFIVLMQGFFLMA